MTPTERTLADALGEALGILHQIAGPAFRNQLIDLEDKLAGVERQFAAEHLAAMSPDRRAQLNMEWPA